MLLSLCLEVLHVDVAVGCALDYHNLHSRHGRACRIGTVRRLRDQTNVTMLVAS